jgi:hypothetical protein
MDRIMTTQKKAILRVCACCEWIFKEDEDSKKNGGCPKCGFAHYGARFVFGDKCYEYQYTQYPWLKRKLADFELELRKEIDNTNKIKKPETISLGNFLPVSRD